jgi:hypothetical protein
MKFRQLIERVKTPNAEYFKDNDFPWVLNLKFALNRRNNLLLGFRTEYSLFTIHKYYNLHNLDYGVELDYLILGRK